MMSQKIQRPKGTQDVTPELSHAWKHLQDVAIHTLELANYKAIHTPIFEATSLFARGVGESTDIVNKEMYSFEKSDRSLTLRPEGTAGVVRAFVENKLSQHGLPQRLYYIGAMFRYERPQEGRQRQFHQIGAELIGLDTPAADAESILLAWQVLKALGISDLRLELNTVGDPDDRPRFREALQALLKPHFETLCADCQRRFEQNPIRMLDCKVPTCQTIYTSDAVEDFLQNFAWSPEASEAFEQLCHILSVNGVPFTVNRRMVRGLDYYSRTVFEFITDKLGAQGTVCGGGRYNGLIEELGGASTPAIGWAMGVERLFKLIEHPEAPALDAYIVTDCHAEAFAFAEHLREQGLKVEVDLSGRNFGKQLQAAGKRSARHVYTIGSQELESGVIPFKNFETGESSSLNFHFPNALTHRK
ncbi:MAG: histidine--tRNA ligase [Vampirovibrionales bacterium]|jgi:histidyl-tRNA synthetase|nr:histidine--tRNA ligase [Vampirovibrionales bacterium]